MRHHRQGAGQPFKSWFDRAERPRPVRKRLDDEPIWLSKAMPDGMDLATHAGSSGRRRRKRTLKAVDVTYC